MADDISGKTALVTGSAQGIGKVIAMELAKLGVSVCMECGSCAFSCPAGEPLVQHMRLAKEIMREAGVK